MGRDAIYPQGKWSVDAETTINISEDKQLLAGLIGGPANKEDPQLVAGLIIHYTREWNEQKPNNLFKEHTAKKILSLPTVWHREQTY